MNLLKELAPYSDEINAHARGFGMSNKEVAGKLVDLWDEWKNIPEISKQIYGSVKNIPATDKGCQGCVADAIKQIINWKKHLEKTNFYKLVPEGSKSKRKIDTAPKKLEPKKASKGLSKEAQKAHNDQNIIDSLPTMKWGEIREMAKKYKIKIHGKKKPQLIEEIKANL